MLRKIPKIVQMCNSEKLAFPEGGARGELKSINDLSKV